MRCIKDMYYYRQDQCSINNPCSLFQSQQFSKISFFLFQTKQQFKQQADNHEKIDQKQVKIIKIIKKYTDIGASWFTYYDKEIKLIKKSQAIFMKIIGRHKKIVKYCQGILNKEHCEFNLQNQWQCQFSFQYSMSLESLENNFIIYQSYCDKGKPIKVSVGKCISLNDKTGQFWVSEAKIIHFYQQITVTNVALLNAQVLCLFGNNSYQCARSSLMIVYNIQQKCTLNYLSFKETSLQKVFWFIHLQYQFQQKNNPVYFDAVESGQVSSLIYQLNPQSYQTDQSIKLTGKIIEIDKDFIFTTNEHELLVYPKIHKRAIYFKWMNIMGVYDIQCLTMIAQLLQ